MMSNFIATGGYSIKNVFDGDPAKNYRLILDNTSIIKDNLNQSIAPERLLISSVEISGTSDPIPFPGYFKIFIKSNAGITRQEYNQLYLNGELDPEGLYVVGEMSNLLVETYRSLQAEDSTTLELSYLPDSIAVYVYLYRDAEFQTLVDIATAPITSDGVKIRKITVEYKIDDQGLTPPETGWTETIPQPVPGKFLWTRVTTAFDDGNESVSYSVGGLGAAGANARVVQLMASRTVIAYSELGVSPGISTLPVTATALNTSGTPYYEFLLNGVSKYSGTSSTYNYPVPATFSGATDAVEVRLRENSSVAPVVAKDILTFTQIKPGQDSYTIILTNESHTFPGSESAAVAGGTNTKVIAFKGVTQVSVTIGTITGNPAGMNVSVSNNSSLNAQVNIGVTTALVALSGELVIPVTVDGKAFEKKFTFAVARKGNDGYMVALTSEAHVFTGSVTGATTESVTTEVVAYKGVTRLPVTIGDATGKPTDMTLTKLNNGLTNASLKIDVTSALTPLKGILTIPLTVDGKVFTKTFSFSVALKGAPGSDGSPGSPGAPGSPGKGVSAVKDQYNSSTSIMEANGEWKDTMPSFISGRYIWTRMEIEWTDNSISHTDATLAHSINETNQRIADMADDNRLTPDEKVTLRRELDIIISERTQVDQQASDYSLIVSERTNFNTAYTTLYNYVNPKLANLTTTEAVNGATLRTYFTDYITKRELLRRKITAESLKEAKRDAAEKDSVIVDRVIEVESEIDADSIVSKVRASTSYVEDLSVFSTKEEAEGYAGAARDEAIAAAESDAQNKANAAYNDAAVYADGIQTTLTDRVEQAEEKITAEAITQTVTSSSTYQEQMANLEPIVHKQATSPDHILNRLWLDTASEPNVMYRSDGSEWIRTSPTSAEDLGAYKAEDAAQLKTDLTGELTTLSTTVEELGSSITSTATAIRTEVSENYTTITDFGTYQTTVATAFEETSKDFNMSFTSVNSAVEAVDGKLTETTEEIRKNIRFVDGKIVLGNTESAIMLEIANDRISFLQVGNPNPVAYISDDTLHITDGNFLSSLRMGNFAFMPNAENGNLSFTKVV